MSTAHLPPKHDDHSQGFSLVEVLVGVLITFAFVGTALQALIISSVFQTSSQEVREATGWIQADLESLKYKANRLDWVDDRYEPALATCTATDSSDGYAALLKRRLVYLDPNDPDNAALDPNDAENNDARESRSGERTYTLTRTTTPSEIAPFNVLQVGYTVTPAGGGEEIISLHTEVMPDASLDC